MPFRALWDLNPKNLPVRKNADKICGSSRPGERYENRNNSLHWLRVLRLFFYTRASDIGSYCLRAVLKGYEHPYQNLNWRKICSVAAHIQSSNPDFCLKFSIHKDNPVKNLKILTLKRYFLLSKETGTPILKILLSPISLRLDLLWRLRSKIQPPEFQFFTRNDPMVRIAEFSFDFQTLSSPFKPKKERNRPEICEEQCFKNCLES